MVKLQSETRRLLQDMFPEGEIISKQCNYWWERYFFLCPFCKKSVFTLYEDPFQWYIACRRCIGYGYQKQRFKGMPEEKIGK